MSSQETVAPPSRWASLKAIKFFMLGVLVDAGIVCLYFLYVISELLFVTCDSCALEQRLAACIVFGVVIGWGLMVFAGVILVPMLLAPPAVGLVVDFSRYDWRGKG